MKGKIKVLLPPETADDNVQPFFYSQIELKAFYAQLHEHATKALQNSATNRVFPIASENKDELINAAEATRILNELAHISEYPFIFKSTYQAKSGDGSPVGPKVLRFGIHAEAIKDAVLDKQAQHYALPKKQLHFVEKVILTQAIKELAQRPSATHIELTRFRLAWVGSTDGLSKSSKIESFIKAAYTLYSQCFKKDLLSGGLTLLLEEKGNSLKDKIENFKNACSGEGKNAAKNFDAKLTKANFLPELTQLPDDIFANTIQRFIKTITCLEEQKNDEKKATAAFDDFLPHIQSETAKNEKFAHNVVVIDIFSREETSIKKGANNLPDTHAIVLWKKEDQKLELIDPSKMMFSQHISSALALWPDKSFTIMSYGRDENEMVYSSQSVKKPPTGYSDLTVADPLPRDCIDIAVKIAFEINEQQRNFASVTHLEENAVNYISNNQKFNKHLPSNIDNTFIRELQSSQKGVRERTRKFLADNKAFISSMNPAPLNLVEKEYIEKSTENEKNYTTEKDRLNTDYFARTSKNAASKQQKK